MVGSDVRVAEVLAVLSLATDLGMGQQLGHAIRCCLIADGLADVLGVGARADVFHVGLLRYVGCTSDAAEMARFAGDEIALAVAVAPHVMGDAADEQQSVGQAGVERAKAAAMAAHCEAAALLATRLGLGSGVVAALRSGFERWDGAGHPAGLAGEAIPLPSRIAVVARDAEVWARHAGPVAASEVLWARRGRAYDPRVVDAFLAVGGALLERVAGCGLDELLAAEPVPVRVPPGRLDALLEVLADFADAKLPYALGHSRVVARLAARAGRELGLDDVAVTRLHQAGLVADLGRVGVSNRIWDKRGPLSAAEREQVRLHPYLSEQVLSRSAPLRPLAALAGAHHERLDGSGYYRALGADELGLPQQVLAAADGYAAMRQDRPHRPALTAAAAADELMVQVRAGRLAPRPVAAVLAAAGLPRTERRGRWPAGLTDREVDVLRLACRGSTKQAVARELGISPKTVNRHLESSYAKIGVSTRAAAALFAVEHGLLR